MGTSQNLSVEHAAQDLSRIHLATSSTSFLYDDCRPQKDANASSCSRLGWRKMHVVYFSQLQQSKNSIWASLTPLKTNLEADK